MCERCERGVCEKGRVCERGRGRDMRCVRGR